LLNFGCCAGGEALQSSVGKTAAPTAAAATAPTLPQVGFFDSVKACERKTKLKAAAPREREVEHKANVKAVAQLNRNQMHCMHEQCCEECWVGTVRDTGAVAAVKRAGSGDDAKLLDLLWSKQLEALERGVEVPWHSGISLWSSAAKNNADAVSKQNKLDAVKVSELTKQWVHVASSPLSRCFKNISASKVVAWTDCPTSCKKQGDVDCEDPFHMGNGRAKTYADVPAATREAFLEKLKHEFQSGGFTGKHIASRKCARYECSKAAQDTVALLHENKIKVSERLTKYTARDAHHKEVLTKGVDRASFLAQASQRLGSLFQNRLMLSKEEMLRRREEAKASAPTRMARMLLSTSLGLDWPYARKIYLKSGRSGLFCEDKPDGVQCDAAFNCFGGPPCNRTLDKYNPYKRENNTLIFTVEPFRGRDKLALRGGRLNRYCRDDYTSGKIVCDAKHIKQAETFKFISGDAYPGWIGLKGGGKKNAAWNFYCEDQTPHYLGCSAPKLDFKTSQMLRVINAEEIQLERCHYNRGRCLDSMGDLQNKNMYAATGEDWSSFDDVVARQKCLGWCQAQVGATGCEFDLRQSKCFVHTAEVETSSGVSGASCWVFAKCGATWFSHEKATKKKILATNLHKEVKAKAVFGKEQLQKTETYADQTSQETDAKQACQHWKKFSTHKPKSALSKADQANEKGFKELQTKHVAKGEAVLNEFSQKGKEKQNKKQVKIDEAKAKLEQKKHMHEHADKVTYVEATIISKRSGLLKDRKSLLVRNATQGVTVEKAHKACHRQETQFDKLSTEMDKEANGGGDENTAGNFMDRYDDVKMAMKKTCNLTDYIQKASNKVTMALQKLNNKIKENRKQQLEVRRHNGCSWMPCSTAKCRCPGGFSPVSAAKIDRVAVKCACACNCQPSEGAVLPHGMHWTLRSNTPVSKGNPSLKCNVQSSQQIAECSPSVKKGPVHGCYRGKIVNLNCACKSPGLWFGTLKFRYESYFSCRKKEPLVPQHERAIHDVEAWYAVCYFGEKLQNKGPCVAPTDAPATPKPAKVTHADMELTLKQEKQQAKEKRHKQVSSGAAATNTSIQQYGAGVFHSGVQQNKTKHRVTRRLLAAKLASDNAVNYELPDDELKVWQKHNKALQTSMGFRSIHRREWHHHDTTMTKQGREYDCPASFGYDVAICNTGRMVNITCEYSKDEGTETLTGGCGCNGMFIVGNMRGYTWVSEPGCAGHFHKWAYAMKRDRLDPTLRYNRGLTACAVKLKHACQTQHEALAGVSIARAEKMALRMSKEHANKKIIFNQELSKFTSSVSKTEQVANSLKKRMQTPLLKYHKIPGFTVQGIKVPAPSREGCENLCNQQKSHCNAYGFRESDNACSLTPAVVTYDVDFYLYVKDGKRGFFGMQGLSMESKVVQTLKGIILSKCKKACKAHPLCASVNWSEKTKACQLSNAKIKMSNDWDFYQKKGARLQLHSNIPSPQEAWKEVNAKMDSESKKFKKSKESAHVGNQPAGGLIGSVELMDVGATSSKIKKASEMTMLNYNPTLAKECRHLMSKLIASANDLITKINSNTGQDPDVLIPDISNRDALIKATKTSKTATSGLGVVRRQWEQVSKAWTDAGAELAGEKIMHAAFKPATYGKPLDITASKDTTIELCIQQAQMLQLVMRALGKSIDSDLHTMSSVSPYGR